MHKIFYANRIFSKLHAKSEKDLKSAEMTNKCLYVKVIETNLVQRNSGKYLKKNCYKEIKKEKKMDCSKGRNFKMCKMSMGGNDTHKNKLVKILRLKQNA